MELTLSKLYPKLIASVTNHPTTLVVSKYKNLEPLLFLLKKSMLTRFFLQDMACSDLIKIEKRFDLQYHLLSYYLNKRIHVQYRTSEVAPSVSSIFFSANWLEREIWDLFGVKFLGSVSDVRRILTDYGFQGHPFRKDFPLSGYFSIRYSEIEKRIVRVPARLSQEYMLKENIYKWNNTKN